MEHRRRFQLRVSFRIVEELTNVTELSPTAKSIYTSIMVNDPESMRHLSNIMRLGAGPVIHHCRALTSAGWVQLISDGRKIRPVAILPSAIEAKLAREARERIEIAQFKGEATTRAFVDWIVAPTVRLVFCARPAWLHNPETGQNLEYDIFSPERFWGVEYQGEQHFGPTRLYPGEKPFVDRFKRDQLKMKLSEKNNVRLSIVTKEDLSLERIEKAIPPDIPRRTMDPKGPFVQMLEKLGEEIARRHEWDRE
ncbi:MAG: hypothetical protein ACOX5M_01985 [Bacillota bacterium]